MVSPAFVQSVTWGQSPASRAVEETDPRPWVGLTGTCVRARASVCRRARARAHMCMVGRASMPSAAVPWPWLPRPPTPELTGHPTANSYVSQALGFSINDLEFG